MVQATWRASPGTVSDVKLYCRSSILCTVLLRVLCGGTLCHWPCVMMQKRLTVEHTHVMEHAASRHRQPSYESRAKQSISGKQRQISQRRLCNDKSYRKVLGAELVQDFGSIRDMLGLEREQYTSMLSILLCVYVSSLLDCFACRRRRFREQACWCICSS